MAERQTNSDAHWSVIRELTHLDAEKFADSDLLGNPASLEDCLRRVLRPHDDAGFIASDQWMMDLRKRLDRALAELTFDEIRRELRVPYVSLPDSVAVELHRLFDSEAFLRYVDAYLYFGIRFLPYADEFRRLTAKSDPMETSDVKRSGGAKECSDTNKLPFPLKPPPELTHSLDAAACLDKFLKIWKCDEENQNIAKALEFLDDFHVASDPPEFYELEEPTEFELWLRGLRPEIDDPVIIDEKKSRFEEIRAGLRDWALGRSAFYLGLNPTPNRKTRVTEGSSLQGEQFRPQEQQVTNPIAARLALNDLYWIARLLRADVGSTGWVQYQKNNWLHLLHFNAILRHEKKEDAEQLRKAEETLRSVFDFVLDLIQNAIDVSSCTVPDEDTPESTWRWRAVFDEELDEIENERRIRHFRDPTLPPEFAGESEAIAESENRAETGAKGTLGTRLRTAFTKATQIHAGDPRGGYWSKRILGQEQPRNLIGLAFSGGGIRSATFNLGVLQGLQEFDLLRHFDYLSTVSGGGFIGSWLVGNVRRSLHWLGRKTDWSDSIRHLRDYSNYLAPRTGVLSADTWNLVNSWLRNTFLIQLTGVAWLFVLLLTAIVGLRAFVYAGQVSLGPGSAAAYIAYFAASLVVAVTSYYLANVSVYVPEKPDLIVEGSERNSEGSDQKNGELEEPRAPQGNNHSGFATKIKERVTRGRWVLRLGVLPAWISAWCLASCFWFHAPLHAHEWICLDGVSHYSEILEAAWRPWLPMMIPAAAGFVILAWNTLRWRKLRIACLVTLICTSVLYLELAAIFYSFRIWSAIGDRANSLIYVFGPAMVLAAFAICILLLIGLTGRNTNEAQREWWTRFGTWLGIFAGIGVFVCGIAVFGPWIVINLLHESSNHGWLQKIKWTAVVSWIGTVISGLFAGKSGKTTGQGDPTNSPKLEFLAKVGGLLFIVGSFLLGSALLYILLFELFGPDYGVVNSDVPHILIELNPLKLIATLVGMVVIGAVFSRFFEINIFGFSQFYRNRIVRCYLGATRWMRGKRKPNEFTKFDFRDDLGLWRLRTDSPGRRYKAGGRQRQFQGRQAGRRGVHTIPRTIPAHQLLA